MMGTTSIRYSPPTKPLYLPLKHRIPESVDCFITVLHLMSERYRLLPQLDVQMRFVQLQIQLLDEFRVRLVHIGQHLPNPWDTPFPQLLNAIW
jgi:hypothetical protein